MKLVSIVTAKGNRLEYELPFDSGLVKNVEASSKNEIDFMYEVGDCRTCFPIEVLEIYFTAVLMNENIFLLATLHIDGDTSPVEEFLNNPDDYYGNLECEVTLAESEKNTLVLALLKNLASASCI